MKSERRAWEIASEDGVGSPYLTTICPSMIFGPSHLPPSELSGSVSVSLFSGWLSGESRCQSRLIVDVRDVAQAFAKAAITNAARGERLIVSSEVRTTGVEIASWLEPLAADGVEVKGEASISGWGCGSAGKQNSSCLPPPPTQPTRRSPLRRRWDRGRYGRKIQ